MAENEAALFRRLAPECADLIEAMNNGVDADFFSPNPLRVTPFPREQMPIVFTGAMDYWPNIDAVTWFAADVLPQLRQALPQVCFYIVGRSPSAAVARLASDAVRVTGTVDDVRPYLQYAAVVVAPMRVARGVQNKILEAMAMGRPVVAAQDCVDAIETVPGDELIPAGTAGDYIEAIQALLREPDRASSVGDAGRRCVVRRYSWHAHLKRIDQYLSQQPSPTVRGRAVNALHE